MPEILDDFSHEGVSGIKSRHGCLTAWLLLVIIGSAATCITYYIFGNIILQSLPNTASMTMLYLLGFIGLINILAAVLLFQWKMIGFNIFAGGSLITFVVNLYLGVDVFQSILGLTGIAVLYGLLQIKGKNNRTGWEQLE